MTATTFCDSIGIATLVRAHKQATANGTELRILPSPSVLRILTIQGIKTILRIYNSLEETLEPPR